jgi:hypothetical protein
MIAVIAESGYCINYSSWDVEDLPKGWGTLSQFEQRSWVVENGKYSGTEIVSDGGGDVIGVEVDGWDEDEEEEEDEEE